MNFFIFIFLLSSLSWKSPGMHNTKVLMFMGIAAHATCEP
jgi:hypothetical protein